MTTDTNKERAEFEAWAVNEGFQIRRLRNPEAGRDYGIDSAQDAWEGWQARAAKAPAAEPVATVYTMEALVPGGSVKHHVQLLKPLPAGTPLYTAPPAPTEQWRDIETAPESESVSFLLLVPGNGAADYLVVQVSKFEGNYYPDVMDCNVDWYSRVTKATHWMPMPAPPQGAAKGAT